MVSRRSQADFDRLVSQSNDYSLRYPQSREWETSPFNWMLALASGTRGAIARRMVEDWAASLGLDAYQITDNQQRYVMVEGARIQVKSSTLWESGEYRFQQIRDQDYDYLLCLGFSPDDIHIWLIPKDEVMLHLAGRSGQHTGAGAQETYWLAVTPGGAEHWLDDYGGQLADARQLLLEI